MRHALAIRLPATMLTLAGVWLAYTTAAYTQTPPPSKGTPRQIIHRAATFQKVKEGLFMIQGDGGNVAAYVTDEGVILVDDMYERNYDDVMSQVKAITNKPIRYVLNTHHHDDHAGANIGMLGAGVEVIQHRNARLNTVALKQPGPARVTFNDQIEVHLGGKEVRAFYFGRAHTSGDAIIYFPELKVIHTGDVFLSRSTQPYIDSDGGGSAIEWTKVLDGIDKLDFDTVIPGHGALSDRAGLAAWRVTFETLRSKVGTMVKAGRDKAAISKMLTADYGWPVGGLALGQLDAFMAEMKSAR
ncbi:MAG: MBL fold metallo-hydrolase [Acidobacteriota bacterium]